LYPLLGENAGLEILRKIDRLTCGMLIWESGDKPEEERDFILSNTSFGRYEKLSATYGTGKVRELGVFFK
jgi:hypothetical protein